MLECCVTVSLGFPTSWEVSWACWSVVLQSVWGFPPPGRCCGHAGVLCYSPSGLPTSWEVLWACWSVVLVSLGFPTSWEVSWACWSERDRNCVHGAISVGLPSQPRKQLSTQSPQPLSFLPDALPSCCNPPNLSGLWTSAGFCWFWPSDFWIP